MTISMTLDVREVALKELLAAEDVKALHCGDIHFVKEDGEAVLIFERKTASDLYSSIVSKRFAEQRERLKRLCLQNVKVCYILEGLPGRLDGKQQNLIWGAIENLVLYHNMFILPTKDVEHTAAVLTHMLKKANEKPITLHTAYEPATVLEHTKKRTLTTANIFPAMLTTIPGVSETMAMTICERFACIKSLRDAWDARESLKEKEQVLTDISLGKRKLGKVLSKRIFDVFNVDIATDTNGTTS